MKFSNLSNKEYLRLNGTLSFERMEELAYKEDEFLETKHQAENAKDTISEILSIAEDYMSDWSDDLSSIHSEINSLKNKMFGSDRKALIKIIEDLEEFQSSMTNAFDHMVTDSKL